jgi:hypothetical protein
MIVYLFNMIQFDEQLMANVATSNQVTLFEVASCNIYLRFDLFWKDSFHWFSQANMTWFASNSASMSINCQSLLTHRLILALSELMTN